MMTGGERADTRSIPGPACVCASTELFRQESVGRRVFFFIFVDPAAFAHESCIKVAIHVRRGVLKFTSTNFRSVPDVKRPLSVPTMIHGAPHLGTASSPL